MHCLRRALALSIVPSWQIGSPLTIPMAHLLPSPRTQMLLQRCMWAWMFHHHHWPWHGARRDLGYKCDMGWGGKRTGCGRVPQIVRTATVKKGGLLADVQVVHLRMRSSRAFLTCLRAAAKEYCKYFHNIWSKGCPLLLVRCVYRHSGCSRYRATTSG